MGYETAQIITEQGIEGIGRYYSSYRAIVVNNVDPDGMNRLKVCVPGISGGIVAWAHAKGQHGSIDTGFKYFAPKISDIVWVSFEQGDLTKPLWEYHGWGLKQVPSPLKGPNTMGIITPEGNTLLIDDDEGSLSVFFNGPITLYTDSTVAINAKSDIIITSDSTVNLESPQVNIKGSKLVEINDGNHGGMVNIKELTQKLNQTIQELEVLRNQYNSHIHSGVTTGPGSSGPTTTMSSNSFSTFNQSDYEDTKSTH
jgi:hypothetical protein